MKQLSQPGPGATRWRLRLGGLAVLLVLAGAPVPPVLEAYRLHITTPVVRIAGLPPEFAGLRIAFIADVHRGPFMSERRLFHMVHTVNEQHPDVVALGGDYVHRNRKYIPSVWHAFGGLHAPLGVYAVLGNHDYWEGADLTYKAMAHTHITALTNRNIRLERQGKAIYIAGVDDPWAGRPDLSAALKGIPEDGIAIVICHNPDYVEKAQDDRARLWLSGHTHGGQVCTPSGRPFVNISRFGQRYVSGLAKRGTMQIYTSRGVGTVTPPVRWNCPAEVPIIELQPA